MARPSGSKDRDYDEKRAALLERIGRHLSVSLPKKSSLRDIAAAAGVTVPTLVHYFGSRADLVAALMQHKAKLGAAYLDIVATSEAPFKTSIRTLTRFILSGLVDARVVDLHAVGIVEASGSDRLGPAYLEHLLEPTLQAVEARLAAHAARGEMRNVDLRVAALCLVSPLLLAALHQCRLGGAQVRHLDLANLAEEVSDMFLSAYAK